MCKLIRLLVGDARKRALRKEGIDMKRVMSAFILAILLLSTLGLSAATETDHPYYTDAISGQESYGIVDFTPNKRYAVYSGPGTNYMRANNGRAMVSTNGWIDVIASDGDWIFIEYEVNAGGRRRGYIPKGALPTRTKVPEIVNRNVYAYTTVNSYLTDDPAASKRNFVYLPGGTDVYILHYYGYYLYVEATLPTGKVRGYLWYENTSG